MSLSTLKKSNSLDKLLGAVQAENAPQDKEAIDVIFLRAK
jgi:hypothetical protein